MLSCTLMILLQGTLQRAKLKAAPWVSQPSAACPGYPWCCTPSAGGASAMGQWLWLSCGSWCLKAFLGGSHAARAHRRSATTSTLHPDQKHPHPNLPGRAWLQLPTKKCLQAGFANPPLSPHNMTNHPLVSQGNIPFMRQKKHSSSKHVAFINVFPN